MSVAAKCQCPDLHFFFGEGQGRKATKTRNLISAECKDVHAREKQGHTSMINQEEVEKDEEGEGCKRARTNVPLAFVVCLFARLLVCLFVRAFVCVGLFRFVWLFVWLVDCLSLVVWVCLSLFELFGFSCLCVCVCACMLVCVCARVCMFVFLVVWLFCYSVVRFVVVFCYLQTIAAQLKGEGLRPWNVWTRAFLLSLFTLWFSSCWNLHGDLECFVMFWWFPCILPIES